MVKTWPSNTEGASSIPGQGDIIPCASWSENQNIKQKQYCKKFSKDFKLSTLKKIFFKKGGIDYVLEENLTKERINKCLLN